MASPLQSVFSAFDTIAVAEVGCGLWFPWVRGCLLPSLVIERRMRQSRRLFLLSYWQIAYLISGPLNHLSHLGTPYCPASDNVEENTHSLTHSLSHPAPFIFFSPLQSHTHFSDYHHTELTLIWLIVLTSWGPFFPQLANLAFWIKCLLLREAGKQNDILFFKVSNCTGFLISPLSRWEAVNWWHRQEVFVSIKTQNSHNVYSCFSGVGRWLWGAPLLQYHLGSAPFFFACPRTFLINCVYMEIRCLNINDK